MESDKTPEKRTPAPSPSEENIAERSGIRAWLNPEIVEAAPDETVAAVAVRMAERGVGSVIVFDPAKNPIGIFTERDVLTKVVGRRLDPASVRLCEVMTSPVETVSESCPPFEIFRLFGARHFRHLPVTGSDGKIAGVLSLRSRGFLQEILKIMGMLEGVHELKKRFLSNVSHDVRSPIITMSRAAALISEELGEISEEEVRTYLKMIEEKGDLLLERVSRLLNETVVEADMLCLDRCDIDMASVIDKAFSNSSETADRKHIRLHFEKEAPKTQVTADPVRITEVVNILIDTVIRATPEGGDIHVSLQPESEGSEKKGLRINVRHAGPPLPQESFRQMIEGAGAGSEEAGEKSPRPGMAWAREIIELHRGRLWLESGDPQGNTFSFTLPAANEIEG